MQIAGSMVAATFMLGGIGIAMGDLAIDSWTNGHIALAANGNELIDKMQGGIWIAVVALSPILAFLFLVVIGSHLVQTGPWFSAKQIVPDSRRLSPQLWFGRLFSITTWSLPAIGISKLLIILAITVGCCWYRRQELAELATGTMGVWVINFFRLITHIGLSVALALLAMSIVDYWIHRLAHTRHLQMSDQQLRDELKSQGSHPLTLRRQGRFTKRSAQGLARRS
jgi:flagellar biosynthesis protein FlhB